MTRHRFTSMSLFDLPALLQAGFQFSSLGTDLMIAASASGSMSIKGFPFVKLNLLAGSLSLSPSPLSVKAASLRVDGQLVNTRISTILVYEAATRVFGMSFTVDQFSLQVRCNTPHGLGFKALANGKAAANVFR